MSSSRPARPGALPRIRTVPPYSTSAGQEAVELAASAGLVLDDWQRAVLIDSLGERADGKWAALEVGLIVPRQNGKGAVVEARELAGLFLFGEQLILHSAHEFKTASEAFRRIVGWIEGSDALRKRVKKITQANGDEGIELRSGARLRFVARSKGSGRGFSGDLNVLDEAYALTAEQLAALMPTMSARANPQIWYTSTPPLEAAAQLVALRKRGVVGEARLAYFEWSPPEVFDAADRSMWQACNPAMGIRISEEFVEAEYRAFEAALEEFTRERLGKWPPAADGEYQVIGKDEWEACLELTSAPAGRVALSADINPARTHTALAVGGRRADGLLHGEVIDYRPGTSWAVDRIVQLVADWKPVNVIIDAAGPAGSLIAPLAEKGIEVTTLTAREAAQACGQLWDATCSPDVSQRSFRTTGEPILTAAVAGAIKRKLADAWAWDRLSPSVDISPLVAVTNALYGYLTAPAAPVMELEGSLMA